MKNIIDFSSPESIENLKCVLLLFYSILSCVFIFLFFNKKKEISHVNINDKKLKNYVGKTSFFYQELYQKEFIIKMNNGLQKNLRFLYSTWLYIFFITLLVSFVSLFEIEQINKLNVNKWKDLAKEKKILSITAEVENENSDYEGQEFITILKDTIHFPLFVKYKSGLIDFHFPIEDSIRVTLDDFIIFNKANESLSNIELKFNTTDSLRIDSLYIKDSIDLIKRDYGKINNNNVYFFSSIFLKEEFELFIDSLNNFSVMKKDSIIKGIKTIDGWTTEHYKTDDNIIVNFVYPQKKIVQSINNTFIKLQYIISRKNDSDKKGLEYKADIDKRNGFYIKKDTNTFINKILRSYPKDTFKYQMFFDEYKTTDSTQINTIVNKINDNNKGKNQLSIKSHITKNWYSTLVIILSLITNVFLFLFFGFLNTKTDLFSKNENKYDVYGLYRILVIGIFFVILIILLLNAYLPRYSNYSTFFSSSFLFVIHLLVSLSSVIAIFGCWGSMNNTYTSFPWFFKLLMFFYAMTQFFELNIQYNHTFFNQIAELFLYFMAIVAKVFIIYILLYWAPKNKRILYFFFTSINNYRTENVYDDFVKILNILELEQENNKLINMPDNDLCFDKTLLKLQQENVKLKKKYADIRANYIVIKETKDNS